MLWTTGQDMVGGARTAVPASLVWCNYFVGPRLSEPCTNFVIFAGIAAGQDRRHAETSAMEEVIERDAVELWWDAGGEAVAIDLPDDLVATLAAEEQQLSYQVLAITGRGECRWSASSPTTRSSTWSRSALRPAATPTKPC